MEGTESFGTLLRRLRKKADLTQEDLAERLGVDKSTISKWEKDASRPRDRDHYYALADALGVSPTTLGSAAGEMVSDPDLSAAELKALVEEMRAFIADFEEKVRRLGL